MQAIPLMLKKREILACAPTGSGKTAAFLVPIIHCLGAPQKKGFRAVIVSPTRELANQTHRECVKLCEGIGLRCHIIDNVSKAAQKFGLKSSQRFGISNSLFYFYCFVFLIWHYSLKFNRHSDYNTQPSGLLSFTRTTNHLFEKVNTIFSFNADLCIYFYIYFL